MLRGLAWRATLEFCALLLGLDSITLEGGSQKLVRILRKEVWCPLRIEVIVEHMEKTIRLLREYEIRFVRRSADTVAGSLVSSGLRCGIKTWKARSLAESCGNHLFFNFFFNVFVLFVP